MPAKTPVTTKSTDGYVIPDQGYYGNGTGTAVTANLKSDTDDRRNDLKNLRHTVWFFSDIDDTDTWTSGIKGIQMCAWTPADATDDIVSAVCTAVATGTITFVATNANSEGWLHVWSRG